MLGWFLEDPYNVIFFGADFLIDQTSRFTLYEEYGQPDSMPRRVQRSFNGTEFIELSSPESSEDALITYRSLHSFFSRWRT